MLVESNRNSAGIPCRDLANTYAAVVAVADGDAFAASWPLFAQ